MSNPAAPTNIKVVPRSNYNVLWWDAVTVNEDGTPVSGGIGGYNVYRATAMNEFDLALIVTVITTDANGGIDTAYLDLGAKSEVSVYRVASLNAYMVESEVSERAVAIRTSSIVDNKEESVDRRLFRLGISKLNGEDILA